MARMTFDQWFTALTQHHSPYDWQRRLAAESACRDLLIRIMTGLGKTEGVLTAWSFHRVCRADTSWPCRLVWSLPMRSLVEQTADTASQVVSKMPTNERPDVHVVMGGEDLGEWYLYPEKPAIIIGTQDMLLSRALNRGYASPRARWPMEFGLLSQDALWVMDEVQLMDVGLATSAQLQAFRDHDQAKGLRPCYTWWMSATLQPDWLRTVDTAEYHADWIREPCIIPPEQRTGGLWDIPKEVSVDSIPHNDPEAFAKRIENEHSAMNTGEYGRITLAVCNTVERACQTFDALNAGGHAGKLELVHSRFRPEEREGSRGEPGWRERFLSRSACSPNADRIIVATQVVEAGVDISAGCLISELAPWPSLVQRFGRCARYGGSGRVVVVDRGRDEAITAPYSPEELDSAWESLQALDDAGLASLESYEESLTGEVRGKLYPFAPAHLLLRRDFDELFDTTPDLTGADLDISRFIRSGDERDLQVFWLDLDDSAPPPADHRPNRRELCAVPFLKARDWLCGKQTKTKPVPRLQGRFQGKAWVWDWIEGQWVGADRASLLPGRVVCVAASCGGYRIDRGFDAESRTPVPVVSISPARAEVEAMEQADDQQDGEHLSFTDWKTIGCHVSEVAGAVAAIAEELQLPKEVREVLALAGRYHDWGKSHPAFQGVIRATERPERCDLAKAPDGAWLRPAGKYRFPDDSDSRPGFRHELASALGLFAILEMYAPEHPALLGPWPEVLAQLGHDMPTACCQSPPSSAAQPILNCSAESFNLLAYLVASHHGKVRGALHAAPKDQDYRDRDNRRLPIRGVREGDRLPAVVLDPDAPPLPEVALTLEPAAMGLSFRTGASWRERCMALLDRYGPAGLAFLEAAFRAADVRASRLNTPDPALTQEASV